MIDTNADMRFMSNNFLETGYNTLAVSSVADGYYEEDLTTYERARTMKFGGRFTIDSTNNKIYINSVTYTLTSGEYNTPSDLATHITTVIAASGVTCIWIESLGANFRFTKGSTFTMNAATLTNAAWATLGIVTGIDFVSTNVAGTYVVYADMPRFHYPNETVTVDFGYQAAIGFVGIISDLSREMTIPEGAVVTFQANTVNDFTTPLVNVVLAWTKRGFFAFLDDQTDTNFRYCRLIIEHPEGPTFSEIGYLYIGDYSTFVDRNISVGVDIEYIDPSIVSNADDGQQYVNEKPYYREVKGISVGLAKPVNVSFLKRLYGIKKTTKPFFVALDPLQTISESIDDMTLFCKFSDRVNQSHLLYNNYTLGFELREVL